MHLHSVYSVLNTKHSSSPALGLSYPNLPRASVYLYNLKRYCKVGEKPTGSHDFQSHLLKVVTNVSIFMRNRNI